MSLRNVAQRNVGFRDRARSSAMKDTRVLYLELMKRCLINTIYEDAGVRQGTVTPFDGDVRRQGSDWPTRAHSMIGRKRLDNIQLCVEDVLEQGVPGDLIEAGVWRGGATIFMRAILAAHGVTNRGVWVADSFAGLPPPEAGRYPGDAGDRHHEVSELKISLEEVRANFAKYDLLDDQVKFLPGWFREALPLAPIETLAVVRVDCDMYGSSMEALTHLYPKLSPGGYLIVDDYGGLPACRQAVLDYRAAHEIRDEIHEIDWTGVYWQRGTDRLSDSAKDYIARKRSIGTWIPAGLRRALRGLLREPAPSNPVRQLEMLSRGDDEAARDRSQVRWRAAIPTTGLTWGREISGDAFVAKAEEYGVFAADRVVLEVGPGYGRLLETCLGRKIPLREYVGLDLSAANVRHLRDAFPRPNVRFEVGDVERASFDRQYDAVISSLTFKHLFPSFENALRNLDRFARPGCMFCFDLIEGDARYFEEDGVTYLRSYTRREILAILRNIPLDLVAFDEIAHDPDHRRLLVIARKAGSVDA